MPATTYELERSTPRTVPNVVQIDQADNQPSWEKQHHNDKQRPDNDEAY
jgi:hypothetical protein